MKMSDEVRLHAIKQEIEVIQDYTKVMIKVLTTLAPVAMTYEGKALEDFESYVQSDEYKQTYVLAFNTNVEIVSELAKVSNKIAELCGLSNVVSIPKSAEDLERIDNEIRDKFLD